MDINYESLTVLFQNFRTEWTDAFNTSKEDAIYKKIAMTVPSTGATVLHAWLNQLPIMREWVGDRVVNNVQSNSITITNRKYENTIEMLRTEIEDDQYGLYTPIVRNMAAEAATNPDALLTTALTTNDNWAGDDTPAPFYGTSRTYGANTINNYTTSALSRSTFETAYINMSSYLGHKDQPLMVKPRFLVVGPKLAPVAWEIIENPGGFVNTGSSSGDTTQVSGGNRNFRKVQIIETARLTGTSDDYWFLLGEVGGIRGLVYQERMPAEFQTARLRPDSDFVFEQDKFQMGTRARGAAFKALPHLIYGGFAA